MEFYIIVWDTEFTVWCNSDQIITLKVQTSKTKGLWSCWPTNTWGNVESFNPAMFVRRNISFASSFDKTQTLLNSNGYCLYISDVIQPQRNHGMEVLAPENVTSEWQNKINDVNITVSLAAYLFITLWIILGRRVVMLISSTLFWSSSFPFQYLSADTIQRDKPTQLNPYFVLCYRRRTNGVSLGVVLDLTDGLC